MTNSVLAGAKSIGQRLFGGYAELLRIPHTARFSVGSVIAWHAVPDGRHDDYDFRTALLRQLFVGRRADGRAGDRTGRCKPDARQAGR